MKRPHRPRRSLSILWPALGLFAAVAASAAVVPTEWKYRQSFEVPAPGLVRVDPTAASFDAAGPRQEDFRIIDANGRELAYLAATPPTVGARTIAPAAFAVTVESDATRISITTGTKTALSSLRLETPAPFFLRAAKVEISDDNRQWTPLGEGLPLFRQWGAEKLSLSLGGRSAAYVRVTISDRRSTGLPFTGASLSLDDQPAPPLVPVGARIERREEFAGETLLTVSLDGRYVPLGAIELPATDPLFMRRITVSVREVNGAVSGERTVGSGTIYRVALEGSPVRTQLEIPLRFTPPTRELLVHIYNGDSPPLALDEVKVNRNDLHLEFMAPAAGTYSLLSGNPQAAAPRYDLAAFAGEMREANATTVILGGIEETPGYHPRESLGPASLPEVPLSGAPLDARDWRHRRTIGITRAGVQELELDPAVLAKSQSDFGDLRVLRAGNQIPYVLERTSLARALTLDPVASPDAKRPSVSVWKLQLPQAGMPLNRLVLSSATPLFQRQFRLYEKLTNENGGAYEITLASGPWSRTPEPGVPETRTFDIAGRSRSDTLWLETDNGDNPAIALGAVQAVYPVVRLIFKTAGTDGFELAYGNATATAPRYDLSLVAVRLLTSTRTPATLGASDRGSGASKNPFAGIKAGYIFWGALALVVIALLLIVAKLIPKPPAA